MPIARLRGVVEEKGDGWAIVGVGGVGMLAAVPATTADALEVGAQASLFTYLHVREDALSLFGFASREELTLFEQLIGVSGVGPRAALSLLSAVDYGHLAQAIAGGQSDVLRQVPGIGQKTAERIVLDLRDKVTPPAMVVEAPQKPPDRDEEVIAALMGLGYSQLEAAGAVAQLEDGRDLPLEDRVRRVLQQIASY
ncbi:MAG: Holliday junction branch migration protein RuvA [Dehalococcoidia bacterium]